MITPTLSGFLQTLLNYIEDSNCALYIFCFAFLLKETFIHCIKSWISCDFGHTDGLNFINYYSFQSVRIFGSKNKWE